MIDMMMMMLMMMIKVENNGKIIHNHATVTTNERLKVPLPPFS